MSMLLFPLKEIGELNIDERTVTFEFLKSIVKNSLSQSKLESVIFISVWLMSK